MKIQKLLLLSAAGLASASVLANGSGMYTPAPAPMMNNNTGVYIEAMGGYNRYAFKDAFGDTLITSSGSNLETRNWSSGNGNWAAGAAIGYQFMRNLSAELGGIYTWRAKYEYNSGGLSATTANFKLRPYYAYLAAKLAVMVYDNMSVFTKLGVGYQKMSVSVSGTETQGITLTENQSNWGAMFGAGLAYNFTPAFYIMGQWLRFTGKIKDGTVQTTAPNLFLLGLGYKFAM
jgi:opacity protein-like surface antigen